MKQIIIILLSQVLFLQAGTTVELIPQFKTVEGLRCNFEIRVLQNTVWDTNWYGSFLPVSGKGVQFSHQFIDVVKGKTLANPWFKCSTEDVAGIAFEETSGRLEGLFFPLDPVPLEKMDTGIVVSEIMYYTDEDKRKEWVELYNRSGMMISLEGWDLVVSDEMTVSRSFCCALDDASVNWVNGKKTVPPGGVVLLLRDADMFKALYPNVLEQVLFGTGEYANVTVIELKGKSDSFNMANNGGTVWLRKGPSLDDEIVTGVQYGSAAEGTKNRSVERVSCFVSGTAIGNWKVGLKEGGTPGMVPAEAGRRDLSIPVKLTFPKIQSREAESRFTVRLETGIDMIRFSLWLCDRNGAKILDLAGGTDSVKAGTSFFHLDFCGSGKPLLPVGLYFVLLHGKEENGKSVKVREKVVISR